MLGRCSEKLILCGRDCSQSILGGFHQDGSEMDCKQFDAAFDPFEETFVRVAVAIGLATRLEAVAEQRTLEPRCAIDEKRRVLDGVVHFELADEVLAQHQRPGWKEPDVEESVDGGIESGNQPVVPSVDLNDVSSVETCCGARPATGSISAFWTQW